MGSGCVLRQGQRDGDLEDAFVFWLDVDWDVDGGENLFSSTLEVGLEGATLVAWILLVLDLDFGVYGLSWSQIDCALRKRNNVLSLSLVRTISLGSSVALLGFLLILGSVNPQLGTGLASENLLQLPFIVEVVEDLVELFSELHLDQFLHHSCFCSMILFGFLDLWCFNLFLWLKILCCFVNIRIRRLVVHLVDLVNDLTLNEVVNHGLIFHINVLSLLDKELDLSVHGTLS